MFLLLSESRYFEFFRLIRMQFLACLAVSTESQCFLKELSFKSLRMFLKNEAGAFSLGSGPMKGPSEPFLARLSAISLPAILLWPGTHAVVTS